MAAKEPDDNNREFRQLQRRSWPVLAVVASACLGLSVMATLSGSVLPGVILSLFFALSLWLIYQGRVWPRWIFIVVTAGLGIASVISSVAELVISFGDLQSWLFVLSSALLIVIAATVFASETLRELAEVRRNHGRILTWASVSEMQPVDHPDEPEEPGNLITRQRLGGLTATLVFATSIVAWLVFIAAVGWLWFEGTDAMNESLQEAQSSRIGLLALFWILVFMVLTAYVAGFMLVAYLVLFFAPFVLTLPLSLPLALCWKQPLKFLVLRPFNRQDVSRVLRRVLLEEVSPLGHCYTLADATIRISPLQRLPLLYGQLTFFTFRARKIVSPHHLAALARAMKRRVLRNINWAVSRDKLFPVASVDAAWQACVQRLVAECDAVIMDLSGVSENIQWELNLLRDTAVVENTVFLVDRAQAVEAGAVLKATFGDSSDIPPLITYDTSGLATTNHLRQRIVAIVGMRNRQ